MPIIDKSRWATLSPHLDQLLELDDDGRMLRIDQIRSIDPPLARELQDLLASLAVIRRASFLEGKALPEGDYRDE